MKRVKLLSFGLVASLFVVIGMAGVASAAWSPNFQASDAAVTVAKDTTHKGSLYATGDTIVVDGTIAGSLYCAGNTITINGTVEGDVLCAGQKLTINGTVTGDVRTAGQFVQVNGTVAGSLTAFAQDVRLERGAAIMGDVNGGAQQFALSGTVGRDVAAGAQMFSLDGEVKGNVDVATEQLQMSNRASVLGNLNYGAQKELAFDDSGVKGEVSFNRSQTGRRQDAGRMVFAAKTLSLLMFVVSAIAMVLLVPRFIDRSSGLFRRQMLLTVLLGFAFLFGGPILVGTLLITVVLAPIGLVLLFGWLAVLVLSGIFFAYWVGAELLRSQPNIVIRMLGGIAVLAVAYLIPFFGGLVLFASLTAGSGMILMTLTNGYKRPSYQIAAKKRLVVSKK